uniref:Uncharacterized protein n=1 Tax=Anguilla anguilla TaxID=7936 RepID=A0A0E9RVR6_ANGAN
MSHREGPDDDISQFPSKRHQT